MEVFKTKKPLKKNVIKKFYLETSDKVLDNKVLNERFITV